MMMMMMMIMMRVDRHTGYWQLGYANLGKSRQVVGKCRQVGGDGQKILAYRLLAAGLGKARHV